MQRRRSSRQPFSSQETGNEGNPIQTKEQWKQKEERNFLIEFVEGEKTLHAKRKCDRTTCLKQRSHIHSSGVSQDPITKAKAIQNAINKERLT